MSDKNPVPTSMPVSPSAGTPPPAPAASQNRRLGLIPALLLILVGGLVLYFTEQRAAQVAGAVRGIAAALESAGVEPNPANDGKVIHVTGTLTTDESLRDTDFGIAVNALVLERTVSMYQWKESSHTETTESLDGTRSSHRTYSYTKTWSEQPINSDSFNQKLFHVNPAMPFRSTVFTAGKARLDAFSVSSGFLKDLPTHPHRLDSTMPISVQVKESALVADGLLYVATLAQAHPDPRNPQVGDLRIGYEIVQPGITVSAIGRQAGQALETCRMDDGTELAIIGEGALTADQLLTRYLTKRSRQQGIIRAICGGLMLLGLGIGVWSLRRR